jgi:hypothetical protein
LYCPARQDFISKLQSFQIHQMNWTLFCFGFFGIPFSPASFGRLIVLFRNELK